MGYTLVPTQYSRIKCNQKLSYLWKEILSTYIQWNQITIMYIVKCSNNFIRLITYTSVRLSNNYDIFSIKLTVVLLPSFLAHSDCPCSFETLHVDVAGLWFELRISKLMDYTPNNTNNDFVNSAWGCGFIVLTNDKVC